MGILNVTPDSFSDGGRFVGPGGVDAEAALREGLAMAAAGAAVLDVGGESTRPGAAEVSPAEEVARIEPVVRGLAEAGGCAVSVDTRHAEVARACLEAGADVLNDVAGFRDGAMVEVAAGSTAGCLVMHMLGEPRTMQDDPRYGDVVADVKAWLLRRVETLVDAGVDRDRIAIDPGIGFGKTTAHNLELLRRLPELVATGHPVVVGASRKRFIGEIAGGGPEERLEGSLAAAVWAAAMGAAAVRVHDVGPTVRALAVTGAIGGAG
ncbi:MAG: dihydropteroate synthase [Coriobacteriia bacterium]|nr:dihydropteroate synthase [Coriobacteriia bacterium]